MRIFKSEHSKSKAEEKTLKLSLECIQGGLACVDQALGNLEVPGGSQGVVERVGSPGNKPERVRLA